MVESTPLAKESGHCRCSQCGIAKPPSEFHNRKDSKNGKRADCRQCRYERNKAYYSTDHGRKIVSEQGKRRWKRNKPVVYARNFVNNLILQKRLTKQPCSVCGDANGQAHHEDYSKPLDIIWLCQKHHMQQHGKLTNAHC